MTDAAFLLAVLNDGQWHSLSEILSRSFEERGCGLTIHSRASDLRKRGFTIEQRATSNAGRRGSMYRLLTEPQVESLAGRVGIDTCGSVSEPVAGEPGANLTTEKAGIPSLALGSPGAGSRRGYGWEPGL